MADQNQKYSYTLIDPDDIEVVKATEYLVENIFVLGESSFVWGRPKFFKTFFVLAALLCVALGVSFFGRKVIQKKVVYFIGEGSDAFMGRIKAWQILNKIPKLRKNFLVVPRIINLFDDNSVWAAVKQVEDQGFRPEVMAVDQLGRAMGKAQENTTDFNQIFANLDHIRQDLWPGITQIVVAHPKKGEDIYRGPGGDRRECR
jgi:hypothetical protein